jgi:hypothetical protein
MCFSTGYCHVFGVEQQQSWNQDLQQKPMFQVINRPLVGGGKTTNEPVFSS